MSSVRISARYPYGAFELKRCYQKNMLLGNGFSVALTIFCILTVWLYHSLTYRLPEAAVITRIQTYADLGPPPSISAAPPQINVGKPEIAMPIIGIPTPVDDGVLRMKT